LVAPSPASPAIHDEKEIPHFHLQKKEKLEEYIASSLFYRLA
jgi:hypothetical protein